MSAPRSPGIYIAMMTLIMTVTLGWSTVIAQSLEMGFFFTAISSAILVSLFAWIRGKQLGQAGMLSIYCLLGTSLAVAVESLIDLANFSLLGKGNDAETGILIGTVVAFAVVAVIAVRISDRFPAALSWGALIALFAVLAGKLIWGKYITEEYLVVVTNTGILTGCIALLMLRHCRKHLSDNQLISLISIITIFISINTPSTSDNLTANLFVYMLMFLVGLHFIYERRNATYVSRIFCSFLIFFGFSGLTFDILHTWIGINEIVVGIPALIFCLVMILWLKFNRHCFHRELYWVGILTFALFGIWSLVPESLSDSIFKPMFGTILLFIISCFISSMRPQIPQTWRYQFKSVSAAFGSVMVIAVCSGVMAVSYIMLINNCGPARLLPYVRNTPLWPGDKAFVRLAMQDESLWSDGVRKSPVGQMDLDKYMKKIRPREDRFSKTITTERHQNWSQGIDNESIGLRWISDKERLTLMTVTRNSPAGEVGLKRGDRVVKINGVNTKDIKDDDTWEKLFGKWKRDKVVSLNVVTRTGSSRNVSMTIGSSIQDPPISKVIHTEKGNSIGYLYLEGFNAAQFKNITEHFEKFKKEGVQDLVLDLRYNQGGSIMKASILTDLIAGGLLEGKLFIKAARSQRYEDDNEEYLFEKHPDSINARRLIILTTDETCSASETVINGLRPYMPVYTVGSTTCGKPYIMQAIEFGENTLMPITARAVNSLGEGHYTKGIRADFKAEDDLTHQLGDPKEGMLMKALEVLEKVTIRM